MREVSRHIGGLEVTAKAAGNEFGVSRHIGGLEANVNN